MSFDNNTYYKWSDRLANTALCIASYADVLSKQDS